MMIYAKEVDMYEDIINSISKYLAFFNYSFKVFRTWKNFDDELKLLYPNVISILQKDVLPDIIVLYHNSNNERKCLIIEVKIGEINIKDIGQAKMYNDIFNADSTLLVSLKKIRKRFQQFSLINKNFLKCCNGTQLYTCVLKKGFLQLQNCFPPYGGLFK